MNGELLRPGVEVIQTIRKSSPSFVRPTLAPCVVGPAFEVLNVLSSDGTINSKALFGTYAQMPRAITESSFPDPRGNIDELDILEESVRPFMLYGGQLKELVRAPGQGFLSAQHVATKPVLQTTTLGPTGKDLKGKVLVIAVDQVLPSDKSQDITVLFVGTGPNSTGNLKAEDVVSQINTQVGLPVASVVAGTTKVQIASTNYGALASITVRAGGSASNDLQLGVDRDERVEGSGFRAQDPKNNTTQSQWVEFYQGDYKSLIGDVWTAGAFPAYAGLVDIVSGQFAAAKHAAVSFSGAGSTFPLAVGDWVFCDGSRLKSGEVMKVEANRFKVGTINTSLSTVDDNGQYTTKVYDVQTLGTAYDTAPFAPRFVYFVANGLDWRKASGAVAAEMAGANLGSEAQKATVQSSSDVTGPFNLAGKTLSVVVTVDGVDYERSFTFTGGFIDDPDAGTTGLYALDKVAAAIDIEGVIASKNGFRLVLSTAKTGRLQGIQVAAALTDLGFDGLESDVGEDVLFTGLTGKSLQFKVDDNPHIYNVVFSSDSLDLAVEEINGVVGYTVAEADGRQLVLTSPLKGEASKIEMVANAVPGDDAISPFGLSFTAQTGSGRPYPDAYLDDAAVLNINAQILRDPVTGFPYDFVGGVGQLYVQYKALRKDVSASAQVPGVIKLADIDTLSSLLNPITEENPLALGMYLAMINAPTFETKGLGIDEVTPSAPEGTGPAWARAAGLLEAEEVYCLAPLTHDETVHAMFSSHATVMSDPTQSGERIVFVTKKTPTRKNPKIALSGSQANSTANSNELMLDSNPAVGLLAAGVNPAAPMPVSAGVYCEVEVAGEARRYSVSGVSGSVAQFRTSFAAGENTDGFYSTVDFDEPVTNSPFSLKVRGASLVIPGSNPERVDYQTLAETVAEANASFKNRRLYSVFPEQVKTVIGGIEKAIPGYYASAAIAGMVAKQPPQQGFTNFPITGLTGVVGTEKFTRRQLNIMAGGGTYILAQDVPGGAVYCRHQVSTDLTSIETRELSITKVVDFTAKMLRMGVRKYIGTNNVTSDLLDSLGATVFAICKFLESLGVLNGFEVNNIAQDKSQPDTVLIDVTLDVPFPCNYIRLTLVV